MKNPNWWHVRRASGIPTIAPSMIPTLIPSAQPSMQPTAQPNKQPSSFPTDTPSNQPSSYPSRAPSTQPTRFPQVVPTVQPTAVPSLDPSVIPSSNPSACPSMQPSSLPSVLPSSIPSAAPSQQPSARPTMEPSNQPFAYPTTIPSRQPTNLPSCCPSVAPSIVPSSFPSSLPSRQPFSQPSSQPSRAPTRQPSRQPSRQPTRQPSRQPFRRPSAQPSRRPSAQPTQQPSVQPLYRPTVQPIAEPTSFPSSQPSIQPSAEPSQQPSNAPTREPTSQPSVFPSSQPSHVPSVLPSCSPSSLPSNQPSSLPSLMPSVQPSRAPSSMPSLQPSSQPFMKPSGNPSSQPSGVPSEQPSLPPSRFPSSTPSTRPSSQPSTIPSWQPSRQPSHAPSRQPTRLPTCQPSGQPSRVPTKQPSTQPSRSPSRQPSGSPSMQPSMLPSSCPSRLPSSCPSSQPSRYPSIVPTTQPSCRPSKQPSTLPSSIPSYFPTDQPSSTPSDQPSSCPSHQPSVQPTSIPSVQPSRQPTRMPSIQPSRVPTRQPSRQPSRVPSLQPSSVPSQQPSQQPRRHPTGQPTLQPRRRPSTQPSRVPTSQPRCQPTVHPSCQPLSFPTCIPSAQPKSSPSYQPATSPSGRPSTQPSSSPSIEPSSQPTAGPTNQPVALPSSQPSAKPSLTPTLQPLSPPTLEPSAQPLTNPSSQPSGLPSMLPSQQPLPIPTAQPSGQPSRSPTSQPLCSPSSYPSCQPSVLPSIEPSTQPSQQPKCLPSTNPTSFPSGLPSSSPSLLPSRVPSQQPTKQPSRVPTRQPSLQPSRHPSAQPSRLPTGQPSFQPRSRPTTQPSRSPSSFPSRQPFAYPTRQPSSQPSLQPLLVPTTTPTHIPTRQPSLQPVVDPTRLPSKQPAAIPSIIPSIQPTIHPSRQPTRSPSSIPTLLPQVRPSKQPSSSPSRVPSTQPSRQPFRKPSTQPSCHPSRQPSGQPSRRPSTQPFSSPSSSPSITPSRDPSAQPSSIPSTSNPTCPSSQPSSAPSMQPSSQPSRAPTTALQVRLTLVYSLIVRNITIEDVREHPQFSFVFVSAVEIITRLDSVNVTLINIQEYQNIFSLNQFSSDFVFSSPLIQPSFNRKLVLDPNPAVVCYFQIDFIIQQNGFFEIDIASKEVELRLNQSIASSTDFAEAFWTIARQSSMYDQFQSLYFGSRDLNIESHSSTVVHHALPTSQPSASPSQQPFASPSAQPSASPSLSELTQFSSVLLERFSDRINVFASRHTLFYYVELTVQGVTYAVSENLWQGFVHETLPTVTRAKEITSVELSVLSATDDENGHRSIDTSVFTCGLFADLVIEALTADVSDHKSATNKSFLCDDNEWQVFFCRGSDQHMSPTLCINCENPCAPVCAVSSDTPWSPSFPRARTANAVRISPNSLNCADSAGVGKVLKVSVKNPAADRAYVVGCFTALYVLSVLLLAYLEWQNQQSSSSMSRKKSAKVKSSSRSAKSFNNENRNLSFRSTGGSFADHASVKQSQKTFNARPASPIRLEQGINSSDAASHISELANEVKRPGGGSSSSQVSTALYPQPTTDDSTPSPVFADVESSSTVRESIRQKLSNILGPIHSEQMSLMEKMFAVLIDKHRYVTMFTTPDRTKRFAAGLYIVSRVTVLVFFTMMFLKLQIPTDTGQCAGLTSQSSCSSRKENAWVGSPSLCLWVPQSVTYWREASTSGNSSNILLPTDGEVVVGVQQGYNAVLDASIVAMRDMETQCVFVETIAIGNVMRSVLLALLVLLPLKMLVFDKFEDVASSHSAIITSTDGETSYVVILANAFLERFSITKRLRRLFSRSDHNAVDEQLRLKAHNELGMLRHAHRPGRVSAKSRINKVNPAPLGVDRETNQGDRPVEDSSSLGDPPAAAAAAAHDDDDDDDVLLRPATTSVVAAATEAKLPGITSSRGTGSEKTSGTKRNMLLSTGGGGRRGDGSTTLHRLRLIDDVTFANQADYYRYDIELHAPGDAEEEKERNNDSSSSSGGNIRNIQLAVTEKTDFDTLLIAMMLFRREIDDPALQREFDRRWGYDATAMRFNASLCVKWSRFQVRSIDLRRQNVQLFKNVVRTMLTCVSPYQSQEEPLRVNEYFEHFVSSVSREAIEFSSSLHSRSNRYWRNIQAAHTLLALFLIDILGYYTLESAIFRKHAKAYLSIESGSSIEYKALWTICMLAINIVFLVLTVQFSAGSSPHYLWHWLYCIIIGVIIDVNILEVLRIIWNDIVVQLFCTRNVLAAARIVSSHVDRYVDSTTGIFLSSRRDRDYNNSAATSFGWIYQENDEESIKLNNSARSKKLKDSTRGEMNVSFAQDAALKFNVRDHLMLSYKVAKNGFSHLDEALVISQYYSLFPLGNIDSSIKDHSGVGVGGANVNVESQLDSKSAAASSVEGHLISDVTITAAAHKLTLLSRLTSVWVVGLAAMRLRFHAFIDRILRTLAPVSNKLSQFIIEMSVIAAIWLVSETAGLRNNLFSVKNWCVLAACMTVIVVVAVYGVSALLNRKQRWWKWDSVGIAASDLSTTLSPSQDASHVEAATTTTTTEALLPQAAAAAEGDSSSYNNKALHTDDADNALLPVLLQATTTLVVVDDDDVRRGGTRTAAAGTVINATNLNTTAGSSKNNSHNNAVASIAVDHEQQQQHNSADIGGAINEALRGASSIQSLYSHVQSNKAAILASLKLRDETLASSFLRDDEVDSIGEGDAALYDLSDSSVNSSGGDDESDGPGAADVRSRAFSETRVSGSSRRREGSSASSSSVSSSFSSSSSSPSREL